ncbi:DUF5133 domain-containing protein [Streptomyces sp. NPDC005132]|uniref:DUF5133 domain-containing protein n=1 Tax=Streptomyces sp. NPDC005132 TaxID=3154294 RepID=UPI0033AE4CE3
MLMAHPVILRGLVSEYESLRDLHAENGSPNAEHRLQNVAYTRCVSTGTRDIDTALIAAHHQLPGARPEDDSLLTSG